MRHRGAVLIPAVVLWVLCAISLCLAGVVPAQGTRHAPGPSAAGVPEYSWPVGDRDHPPPVRRGFDPPPQPWLSGHRGVDLAAPEGTAVRAAGAGRVVFAGMVAGRPVISVAHPDGLRTTYEPVKPAVSAGEQVAAGDRLGTLVAGSNHCATTCLHWGARSGPQRYVNPLLLVRQEVVIRLYPIQG